MADEPEEPDQPKDDAVDTTGTVVSIEDRRLGQLTDDGGPRRTPEERSGIRARAISRRLEGDELTRKAFLLRVQGASYEEIGQALDIDRRRAGELVDKALAAGAIAPEKVAQYRDLELARLDQMTLAVLPKARKGDLGAVDRMLKIMERRARYMPGLEVESASQTRMAAAVGMSLAAEDGSLEVKVVFVDDWRTN